MQESPLRKIKSNRNNWGTEDLCKYCDNDTLKDIAKDNSSDDYEYENVFNQIYASTGICRHCKDEETADFRDDD